MKFLFKMEGKAPYGKWKKVVVVECFIKFDVITGKLPFLTGLLSSVKIGALLRFKHYILWLIHNDKLVRFPIISSIHYIFLPARPCFEVEHESSNTGKTQCLITHSILWNRSRQIILPLVLIYLEYIDLQLKREVVASILYCNSEKERKFQMKYSS